jgi:Na+-translocating ferredoxin:NAD+ oxidoreductase RnfC subunit
VWADITTADTVVDIKGMTKQSAIKIATITLVLEVRKCVAMTTPCSKISTCKHILPHFLKKYKIRTHILSQNYVKIHHYFRRFLISCLQRHGASSVVAK